MANVQLSGATVEIDVATLREDGWEPPSVDRVGWEPPAAAGTAVIDFTGLELYEVLVLYSGDGQQLVGAVELLSRSNKDRPANRRVFVTKCASYLEQGASVLVVDVVTDRHAPLHGELLEILGVKQEVVWTSPSGLSAIAYRPRRENEHTNIDWWTEPLAIGSKLPKMPLWIGIDVNVPIDLESTYMKTFEYIRVPIPSPERNGT
jgi:hypothetical protein